jgi:ribosomal protein S18 acetylase RimI-like enzyme
MTFRKLDKEYLDDHADEFLSLIKGWKFSEWGKENFLYELPKKWDFSFAVFDGDNLAGFCIASNKIMDAYYIHLIFIAPSQRGKNLGKKMIEHATDISKKAGISKIELRCPETNVEAVDFYTRVGFKEIAKLKDDVSGDVADHYFQLKLK